MNRRLEFPRHPSDRATMVAIGRRGEHRGGRKLVHGLPVMHRKRRAESLERVEAEAQRLVLEQNRNNADFLGNVIETAEWCRGVAAEAAME